MVPVLFNLAPAAALVLTCLCAAPLRGHKPERADPLTAHLARALRGQKPEQVDPLTAHRADPQCWDSSSALLLEMRSPRIADTVTAFWDLMGNLRSSDNGKHTALFWDLARVFWDIYLDCVLSRSHGLGRRQVTSVRSLITDKSLRFNSSRANSWSRLTVSVRPRGHITTLKSQPK